MLTQKQLQLLRFIIRRQKSSGISPSFDEMKIALGLKSKSGIHRLITNLEERGFIRKLPHRARALEIIKLPDTLNIEGQEHMGFTPNVIDGGLSSAGLQTIEETVSLKEDITSIPFYGKIAAGLPIEALSDQSETLSVPNSLIGPGNHYALRVEGDSMIDAGIFDGDIAIIQYTETPDNGSIVVALIDDNESTLKRIRKKGQSIALEPANKAYKTRIFGLDQISIQGKLKAIIRSY
jgi:repressor LexA